MQNFFSKKTKKKQKTIIIICALHPDSVLNFFKEYTAIFLL